jgi:hypothetical protein
MLGYHSMAAFSIERPATRSERYSRPMTDVPPELALNYYVGRLTIQDSWTEHEARVLWKDLAVCGVVKGQWAREFGRLLPKLEDAFKLPQIPKELRDIALPLLALTRKWHKYRADLVHDMVSQRSAMTLARWTI